MDQDSGLSLVRKLVGAQEPIEHRVRDICPFVSLLPKVTFKLYIARFEAAAQSIGKKRKTQDPTVDDYEEERKMLLRQKHALGNR